MTLRTRLWRDGACAGVAYASRNVLEDPELREGIKAFTAWPTIPQVFIAGQFVVRQTAGSAAAVS